MTVVQSIASAKGAGAPDAEYERATTGAARILSDAEPPDSPLLSCLSIIAGLLERPISTKALRAGLPLVDEQFTPDLFIRAAQRAGIFARLVKRDLAQISPLNMPCVLLLKSGACVLTALPAAGHAQIILPETGAGASTIALAELSREYDGLVLFAKAEYRFDDRTQEIGKAQQRSWFWGTLFGFWRVYSHAILASLVVNLFALASPIFIMNVYDRVVPNNAVETLWVLAIGVILVFVFDFILRTARSYFVDAAGKSADVILASRLFEHVLGMVYEARPASVGALAANLGGYESVREFFTSATLIALADLPFAFLFISVIWLVAGPVAIIPLLAVPIVVLIGAVLQVPMKRVIARTLRESFQKHAILVESLEGLDTIKIAAAEGRARFLSTLAVNLALLIQNLVSVLVVVYGVYLISAGELTTGALVAATLLTARVMAPLSQVAALIVRLHQSLVSLGALDNLMQTPLERPPGKVFLHRPRLRGQIEFRNVEFHYPQQKQSALEGVSFFIGAGEKVGIIGRIGSGKSTIARLIAGLYQPSSGSILLDGTDLRQIDPADLRRNMGYTPQDAFLFFGSVKENISIAAPHADHEAILRAATIAGVDDFVKRHPQGYDLPVGENGRYLSGGQRESITIARALLLDPPLLIMDEPTGSMDNASEGRLRARLAQLTVDRTVLLVTHRSSMLSLVDRLIVLDGGRVVADGPKDDVLRALTEGKMRVPANAGES
jgi:ATP-binding cassette subfamily C protein LapB